MAFCGDEAVSCSLSKELELTTCDMRRGIAVSEKVTPLDAAQQAAAGSLYKRVEYSEELWDRGNKRGTAGSSNIGRETALQRPKESVKNPDRHMWLLCSAVRRSRA